MADLTHNAGGCCLFAVAQSIHISLLAVNVSLFSLKDSLSVSSSDFELQFRFHPLHNNTAIAFLLVFLHQ